MSRIEIAQGPIRTWPGSLTVSRRASPFKADYRSTVDLLEAELVAVRAQAIVLQRAISKEDMRLDGQIRSGARIEHPGVILSFTSSKIGKVRFACDRFVKWQDNVRAIALGMEALRKVDRYGITSDGEQYAGFRAIEAAESARAFETVERAAEFIVAAALGEQADPQRQTVLAEAILVDEELVDTYYRRAARALHPDAGGSETAMARLNVARAMLDEHRE